MLKYVNLQFKTMMTTIMSPGYSNFTGCFRDSNRTVKVSHETDPRHTSYDVSGIRELKRHTFWDVYHPETTLESIRRGYYEAVVPLKKVNTNFHYHEFTELARVKRGHGDFFIGPPAEEVKENEVDADQIARIGVRPGTVISIPKRVTHGFHVPDYMVLEVAANSIEYKEEPLKVNKVDDESLVLHKYLVALQRRNF